MERTALILYLENIRDLEVVKNRLISVWKYEYRSFQRDCNNHPTKAKKPQLEKIYMDEIIKALIILPVVSVLDYKAVRYCTALQEADFFGKLDYFLMTPVVIFLSSIILFCFFTIIKNTSINSETKKSNRHKIEQYEKDCLTAINNTDYVKELSEEWKRKNIYFKSEQDRIEAVLEQFYAMNIIPLQYRKLSAVCYLCDFMSSCQESYQMALISNQIEDGIRRLESRLDEIIDRLDTAIWQQRVIREENRQDIKRQIDQNNRMIDSLKRMENSQKNIEEYSRLSANYNEAQALIGMAYYLKH